MSLFIRCLLLLAFSAPLAATAEPSMLRVTCGGDDVSAEVSINGKFRGECPVDIKVAPGILKLKVVKKVDASYDRVFEQEIRMGEGIVKKVDAVLTMRLSAEGQRLEDQRLAAKKATADIDLGESYLYGKGVAQDYAKALELLAPLAAQGHAKAQHLLGNIYDSGKGVPKDQAKAFKWYQKAAAQEYGDAEFALGYSYDHGEGIAQNSAKAIEWYQKAAEKQCCAAQINLGLIYRQGKGVPQDYARSMEWLKKSEGAPLGKFQIGFMYYEGYGVAQDYSIAIDWFQKAADNGIGTAMLFLGIMYENGQGFTKDLAKAVEWYKKAAANGQPLGQKNLDRLNAETK